MSMFVSALALTSLDSVARIGRMSFQEFFEEEKGTEKTPFISLMTNKYFATAIILFFGFVLSLGGYNNIWPLFGASNQLLAALVLIALAVFLKVTGRKGYMLWIPMCYACSYLHCTWASSICHLHKTICNRRLCFLVRWFAAYLCHFIDGVRFDGNLQFK